MILRPEAPEEEELEDERYNATYADIWPSISRPQTSMGSSMRDT